MPDINQVPFNETTYYARHFKLPGFDAAVQAKLKNARVLIVGVGGLGCPAALYLAGAGVGNIILCDADDVSATNLHRQVLFDTQDIGEAKVEAAGRRLLAMNPHIAVTGIRQFADADLLRDLVKGVDFVLDGTDNFAAKYAINDACAKARVPLVYGSIFQFQGQVSVFHAPAPGQSAGFSYRDLYPNAPPAGLTQNCGEAGVVGVLPGIIGTLQANEVIKLITGLGETLAGKLLMFDALEGGFKTLRLAPRGGSEVMKPVRSNCDSTEEGYEIDEIGLRALEGTGRPALLVDVRDASEHSSGALGEKLFPLPQLHKHLTELGSLGKTHTLVLYCKTGARSGKGALYLRSVLEGIDVYSLRGGVDGMACVTA